MKGRTKIYASTKIADESKELKDEHSVIINLPLNPHSWKVVDLTPLMGQGLDDWVVGCADVFRARLSSGNFTPASISTFAGSGINIFIPYLAKQKGLDRPAKPSELRAEHVAKYVAWLRAKFPNSMTARAYYNAFKTIVIGLEDQGLLKTEGLWPGNPFPVAVTSTEEDDQPMSPGEMQRLASALKADLSDIHHGRFKGIDSEAIVVLLLIVAMRSGINTTPLLEMRRDCLRPHPFMPGMMLLGTEKRRGNGAQDTMVRQTSILQVEAAVQMDAVAVINKALEITAGASNKAPEAIKDRLWLYASSVRDLQNKGKTLSLTRGVLGKSVASIVKRHGLLADDGSSLALTLSRLRKTKEHRLWRLSDGDLLGVASAMGHTPKVADNHYLKMDRSLKAEGALFIGADLPSKLRGIPIVPTPTGGCVDTLHGSRAPKDGTTHCEQFMDCLGCPSYAVVGTVKDLRRLFSFQQFLRFETQAFPSEEWKDWRAHREEMAAQIDRFVDKSFPSVVVSDARELALLDPHPFWAIRMRAVGGVANGK